MEPPVKKDSSEHNEHCYTMDFNAAGNVMEKQPVVVVPPPPPPPLQSVSKSYKIAGDHNALLKSVMIEHCYARPYNWRPDANFLRPTKTLFITQQQQFKRRVANNPLAPHTERNEILDVETVGHDAAPSNYDAEKAKRLMNECEHHAHSINKDENDDWEEKITRTNWTPGQNHLFNIMVNILNSDRMSRLAYTGIQNEPILRRTVIEKSVKRFRQLMAKYSWDVKLGQWLHQLLIDHLCATYLASYLDILQTLRNKLPVFVDKLLAAGNTQARLGPTSAENLLQLFKRPWDPIAGSLNQEKPKKMPGNPVIVIVPSAPSTSSAMYSKRLHRWINLFSNLSTVSIVHNNIGSNAHKVTMMNCVDQMFAATRAKIQEVKAEYANRPIVLVGLNAGAAIALQVAQVETVLCVICLGFSIHTAEGNRGEPDDNLLDLQVPVLFVIGQNANTATQENMEDIRERMRVETGLLMIGAADDYLRLSIKKKRAEGVTQTVVDRCIVDEVGEFVSGLLLSPYPPQIRQMNAHIPTDAIKRPKAERKRNNSNTSSLDSEPPSPTPRISRPGQNLSPVLGRPPGSKSKSKIEAKWHAMQQGIPPLISTTPSTTTPTLTTTTPQHQQHLELPRSEKDPTETIKKALIGNKNDKLTQSTNTTTSSIKPPPLSAKLQALTGSHHGRTIYQGSSTLSSLLQGGVRTLPPNPQAKQIKENIATSGKMMGASGRLELTKMSTVNSANKLNVGSNYGNVVITPDGKIKQTPPTIRGLTKYITSKKQLLANRNKLVKKLPPYPPPPLASSVASPPTTTLTSQDIMDLPIIFADDNTQVVNASAPSTPTMLQHAHMKTNPNGSKMLFLNKSPNNAYKQNMLKRSSPNNALKTNPVKYAKIILSKAPSSSSSSNEDARQATKLADTSSSSLDLEDDLVATAITKSGFMLNEKSLLLKKGDMVRPMVEAALLTRKMNVHDEESDDPDYFPNKSDI